MERFCETLPFGWLVGYGGALRMIGVRTVLFYVSARVNEPVRFTHEPTGTTICLLPAPGLYRGLTRTLTSHPGPWSVSNAFGRAFRGVRHIFFMKLAPAWPWLTTPIVALAREMRREGCDVVLSEGYETARFQLCVLLSKLMRLPVFATCQGEYADPLATRFERLVHRLTLRLCTGFIIAPQAEVQRVRSRYGVPPAKMARIFNPIDLAVWGPMDRDEARASLGIPGDAQVVVRHGRVELYDKGLDVLLDAWDLICRERPERNLRLLLIGMGSDADRLKRMIAERQPRGLQWVANHVTDRTAIRRYLSAGDVYAFPSRVEGLPVSPLEAMACGLPVVATDASGVPDIFEDGPSSGGIVVPRGDAAAFALALGQLLDDRAWAQELGERARRRIETCFSLEAVGEQLGAFMFGQTRPFAAHSISRSPQPGRSQHTVALSVGDPQMANPDRNVAQSRSGPRDVDHGE